MAPRKNKHGTSSTIDPAAAKNALDWVKARIAEAREWSTEWSTRRLPKAPRRTKLRARPRSFWSSYWAARMAVRSGIPLEGFLRHRLEQHLARLPVAPDRLPEEFAVEGNLVVKTARSDPRPRAPWLESFLREHGSSAVNPEILLGQADAARLAARIDPQRGRVDELTHDVEAATRGVAIADPGDERQRPARSKINSAST